MEPIVTCVRHVPNVAIVTLNRPQKRNALTIELMDRLNEQLHELERESVCRCVILRGAGPVFCAGLDLDEAANLDIANQSAQRVATTLESIATSPLVTIAAAHGAAFAGGAGLMSACDLVVAADNLQICFPEVRRGLVPALVSTVLRKHLRASEMLELFLLAEPIDVNRARGLGLVQRIVTVDRLLEEAIGVAQTVCKGGPDAVRHTKHLVRQICSAAGMELTEAALAIHTDTRMSQEAEEGLAAFGEKRDPNW